MVWNLKSQFSSEPKNSCFFLGNQDIINGCVEQESRKEKKRKQEGEGKKAEKTMEKKNVQWSAEETKCLVAIWASPEFQEKLETSTRKSKLYNKLSEEMAKAGFTRTPDQIINQLKKLKKDYRDTKTDLSKSGAGYGDTGDSYELLDSVMGHRPANQVTGALNSATAATTVDESGSSIYDGGRLTTHHSLKY